MMKIVLDAGYHGYVGIEYEGGKLSEPEGIKATKKLLEKVPTGICRPRRRKRPSPPSPLSQGGGTASVWLPSPSLGEGLGVRNVRGVRHQVGG